MIYYIHQIKFFSLALNVVKKLTIILIIFLFLIPLLIELAFL
ncbi:hypothetical protein H04402_02209 [Clostridium botulinum H04402 065]|nr:hypothetical protein H04402_02209 [Clostridium botulinum H04402 065]